MGFFGLFDSLRTGGNFRFIAQNIGAIYYATQLTPYGNGLTDEQRQFATGLIDAVAYISEGTITEREIHDAVLFGASGRVFLDFYTVRHRDLLEYEENASLVGFTMQMEALIFQASGLGIGYREIVDQVVRHKREIAQTINRTLSKGTRCSIFPAVMQNTTAIMASPDFQSLVQSFKI